MLGTKEREPTEGAKFKEAEGIVERDERIKNDQEPKYAHFYTVVALKDELYRVCANCGSIFVFRSGYWEVYHSGDGSCLVLAHSP